MRNIDHLYYIDKTEHLEEGIKGFPSIYIEGNAATGKTVAVRMLLDKYPDVSCCTFNLELELKEPEKFLLKLEENKKQMEETVHWIVLDNIPAKIDERVSGFLTEMVRTIENQSKVIFVSREKPQSDFLSLFWEEHMELISMDQLLFTVGEVRKYVELTHSTWNAKELFEKTGGWAGCVAMLVRLQEKRIKAGKRKEISLFETYEMKHYVETEILSGLSENEKQLLSHISSCTWVTENFCVQVWECEDAPELLQNLYRKGLIFFEPEKKQWKINKVFDAYIIEAPLTLGKEDDWYEAHGYIREALLCKEKINAIESYQEYMIRNYKRIPIIGSVSENVLKWNNKDVRENYLRGVYYYQKQMFDGLDEEIELLEKTKEPDHDLKEILLNLHYLNPKTTLDTWLEMLAQYTKSGKKFHLYSILGYGVTCLCGIRDLSGLFIGTKKDVKQREKLWKQSFGEYEWNCYQLARIDFYLETEQKEAICEEDWQFLNKHDGDSFWQLLIAKLYLLCKLQRENPEQEQNEKIASLEKLLYSENNEVCRKNAEAISSLYAPWCGKREKLMKWLRETNLESVPMVTEENHIQCYCAVKGYILLNQYDRADKLIKKLIPFLQPYQRNRLMTEILFEQAIVLWKKELKGHAILSVIESFLICRNSRYVGFYASYGQRGCPVLEAYIEWQNANAPEGWSRKKKYNYGNVLRMPLEDYVQVVLRTAKKVSRADKKMPEDNVEEYLTMMETMVLQNIGYGLSNSQICEVLGVKLPTVKGHAYSLYRKLGVENRTQAVRKGKELGIIE